MPVRTLPSILALALVLTMIGPAAADHVPDNIGGPQGFPADEPVSSSGDWRFVANFPMGPGETPELGTDVEIFERDGKTYALVGSMTLGFRIFEWADFTPETVPTPVSDYASAFPCTLSAPATIIENVVDGDRDTSDTLSVGGWQNDVQVSGDGMIASIATDADGRCHDIGGAGVELVDISDLTRPHLFHLVRSFGEAHNSTIDKQRGLIYVSSSDAQLNAIDIIDFRSCRPPATEQANFDACRPVVARYQFPIVHEISATPINVPAEFKDPAYPLGLTAGTETFVNNGCHDITVQGDRMYCAALSATVIFDISGVMQKNGQDCKSLADLSCELTGTHLTDQADIDADADPAATGLPPACPVVDGTPGVGKAASVTDCDVWSRPTGGQTQAAYEGDDFMRAGLDNANVEVLSVIRHGGGSTTKPETEDIAISHEADPTEDGDILIITDERGGGLQNPCGTGTPAPAGGGAWFYDIRDPSNPKPLTKPDGSPGVFISENTPVNGNCTIHVIVQVPGTNVIVAAWYIEGTHVFTYDANLQQGTVSFEELGHYIPGAGGTAPQTWTSYPVGFQDNVLYVQTGDMARGTDVLAFTLPEPVVQLCPGRTKVKGNHVVGTSGKDILIGKGGRDVLCGEGGNDTLRGKGGRDRLFGGDGKDRLRGGKGGDRLKGEGGNDNLVSHKGRDRVNGGNGRDFCKSGPGKDRLKSCEKGESTVPSVCCARRESVEATLTGPSPNRR